MSDLSDRPDLRRLEQALRDSEPLPKLPDDVAERTVRAIAADRREFAEAGQGPEGGSRAADEGRVEDELVPVFAGSGRQREGANRVLMPMMVAALVATLAIFAVTVLAGGQPGELELETTLAGTDAEASIEVREVGEGRLISIESNELEVLPTGEYYELWFVGEGDSEENPNRVSAGTFHPNPQGRTDVELFGAVNPAKLPQIEITAEPADGDPSPSGNVTVSGS